MDKEKAARIEKDLQFVMGCFHQVLAELGETEHCRYLPWINQNEISELENFPDRLSQIYSISFELLNMVEQNTDAQVRRRLESELGLTSKAGLWGYYLNKFKQEGHTKKEILQTIRQVHVEPVLTAHPTEAKRATVLRHHRDIYLHLIQRENSMWNEREQALIQEEIKADLERLWRTGEIYLEKPDVHSEVQNILHYLKNTFPEIIPRIDRRLQLAWQAVGYDLDELCEPSAFPTISFGNWVGGDRDGHPLVSPEITAQTLTFLRDNALEIAFQKIDLMAKKLSLASQFHQLPPEFLKQINSLEQRLGVLAHDIAESNSGEPIRHYLNLILALLPPKSSQTTNTKIKYYQSASELVSDLEVLYQIFYQIGAQRLAQKDIFDSIRSVHCFGFHLAKLDIRQNSRYHSQALCQMLQYAGLDDQKFLAWNDEQRLQFLLAELKTRRPFTHCDASIGPEADNILSYLQVIRNYIQKYGSTGIGSYIISMTKNVTDLLTVYLFAREAGLLRYEQDRIICLIPIVPLFETIEDLRHSPDIVDQFLSYNITQTSLTFFQQQNKRSQTTFQVMVGYSDSNKDGGIVSSNWQLNRCQLALHQIGIKHKCQIVFFHGKGGTISRGAGPTHRFLDALPHGTVNSILRLTEQGETISQKYANHNTATYNLELLVAGTAGVSLLHRQEMVHILSPIMDGIAQRSKEKYQALINQPGFIEFYSQATPIDAIEYTRFGSRPSRRSGARTLDDLRAIPWVFSWNQSRFYLSGWYGVGSALYELKTERNADYLSLKAQINDWSVWKYILTNVETSVFSASLEIMSQYASLVTDIDIRDTFMKLIADEYQRTIDILDDIYDLGFIKRRPGLNATLQLRADPLRILHRNQISLLKKWRHLQDEPGEQKQAEALLSKILRIINAIASGLRTTG